MKMNCMQHGITVSYTHLDVYKRQVKDDMHLPGYHLLRDMAGLFQSVQLDQSRTCVFWNDEIDLPSDIIYEYGRGIDEH